ncbi:phosphoacetylglucosamine mutase [Leptopilina boulardi]|uniref:phosphoacetylglucosamine mutase n=1 Tax=Leptopilina boulardi TaxID=63433 RepID=UPI0021F52EEB|nr:phosphoacetylglucosamine mutase [Leptopilina boulardi]
MNGNKVQVKNEQYINYELIETLRLTKFPKPGEIILYGTAGFRTRAELLDHVAFTMGILSVLRSKKKNAAIGIMITASHNPENDNGLKLVDPSGEMLESSWEKIATDLVNIDDRELVPQLKKIIKELDINETLPATVILGRDTRISSPQLAMSAIQGINACQATLKDFEIVTTPQLHYLVASTNANGSYGDPSLFGYYQKLSVAFKNIRGNRTDNGNYFGKLQLDAANGVGALAVKQFQEHLNGFIDIDVYNNGNGQLNHKCGADYVKIEQCPPSNLPVISNMRCVSIDGDADRIVYYYTDEENKFHLLDGDRIATLIAEYFKELLLESQLILNVGLVQTAYANGGSTDYITNKLKIPVACVPTGVKHLHHKALEFDIGIYFEANGHGTIVFKDSATELIRQAAKNESLSENKREAAKKLSQVIDVINQTVGDALSDMLLVETILHAKKWNLNDWEQSYRDLPNKQLKVKVLDRNAITTMDAERKCVLPEGLQTTIDQLVMRYSKGRSFVRPSGTEDIVRVYAECENKADVEKLAVQVGVAVFNLANGVGQKPVLSKM